MTARLQAKNLVVTSAGRDGSALVSDASFCLESGQMLALIGPNGSGKSTLLSVLAGSRLPYSGSVDVDGRSVQGFSTSELAQRRSVLTQDRHVGFAFSVEEVVRMGRHPHRKSETHQEHETAVAAAIDVMELDGLLDRAATRLSGGEKARVAIARVLAQSTPILMFDEPTAALDLRYQQRLINHCEQLAEAGVCVVMVLHDLSLAARADLVGLIHQQRLIVDTPAAVLTAHKLEAAFNVAVQVRHSDINPSSGSPSSGSPSRVVLGVDLGLGPRERSPLVIDGILKGVQPAAGGAPPLHCGKVNGAVDVALSGSSVEAYK